MSKQNIRLFGMNFEIDGNWLIGSTKDINRLSFYIFLFVFSLIFIVCIIGSIC